MQDLGSVKQNLDFNQLFPQSLLRDCHKVYQSFCAVLLTVLIHYFPVVVSGKKQRKGKAVNALESI